MFLGKTQKNELVSELIELGLTVIANDIESYGVKSEYVHATDVDNQQIGIKIDEDTWLYSQQNKFFYSWETDNDIDVENYTTEIVRMSDFTSLQIEEVASSFYQNLEDLKKSSGDSWKQIVLECAFENLAY